MRTDDTCTRVRRRSWSHYEATPDAPAACPAAGASLPYATCVGVAHHWRAQEADCALVRFMDMAPRRGRAPLRVAASEIPSAGALGHRFAMSCHVQSRSLDGKSPYPSRPSLLEAASSVRAHSAVPPRAPQHDQTCFTLRSSQPDPPVATSSATVAAGCAGVFPAPLPPGLAPPHIPGGPRAPPKSTPPSVVSERASCKP